MTQAHGSHLIFYDWSFGCHYIWILVATFLGCSLPIDLNFTDLNWEGNQKDLSCIINKAIALQPDYVLNSIDQKPNQINYLQFPSSAVLEPCLNLEVGTQIGCCQPGGVTVNYVFNAKLEKNK